MTATNSLASYMNHSLQRGRSLLLASAIACTLAACGGGGGNGSSGASSPPPTQPGSSDSSSSGAPAGDSTGGSTTDGSGGATTTPVVYIAEQNAQDVLFLVQPNGPVRLNPSLVAGGDVYDFALSPDGKFVIYVADQDIDTRYELYRINLDAPGVAIKLNPALSANRDVMDFALSPDGAKVVYRSDSAIENIFELYLVDLANPGTSVKFSGALTPAGSVLSGYKFSPDGARVAYRADQDVLDRTELYSVPIASPGVSVKLNATLVQEGDVTRGFAFTPDSTHVGYVADQDVDTVLELYAVALANPGVAAKLNGALTAGGDVCNFTFSPDSSRVAYCADQQTDDVTELFTTPLSAPGTSTKLSPPLVTGGGRDRRPEVHAGQQRDSLPGGSAGRREGRAVPSQHCGTRTGNEDQR